ncbi:glycosyltransferase family 2 protein [Allokutzneria sp. A3M-2-11 16]|uniref:glycosyltransferase family 2 protein n=1 Tax=Allokutzneria sp. A3M-2-11 16 TaxID=2962043 RepID=UPI0020B7145C|nr:glycosyltransferase family 2 protein [Allokutzneria sp. A3M-2-11 16]MCP3801112.1 glycosyltransferase family 2 protein [Allokutzneria sp. A3M-2-11 16]
MSTPVVIAVVTYNSAHELPELFEGLPDALEGVPEWRVVVADNASSDGSADLARELLPSADVVETGGNLGYAAGVNACMARAKDGEALFVLNADVRLAPGSVARLLGVFDDRGVGIAVPEVTRPNGEPEPTLRRRPTPLRVIGDSLLGRRAVRFPLLSEEIPTGSTEKPDWANGAALLIAPAVWPHVGDWRAELFLYSEEVDYCLRVQEAGWSTKQVRGARAVHKGGEVATSPKLWAQLVTNRVVHAAKWNGAIGARIVWGALVLAQLIRLPLRRGTHLAALRALLSGRRALLSGKPTNPGRG